MSKYDLKCRQLRASQSYCDWLYSDYRYRINPIETIEPLTFEDFDLICNPNLQISQFKKTSHAPELAKLLFEYIRFLDKNRATV